MKRICTILMLLLLMTTSFAQVKIEEKPTDYEWISSSLTGISILHSYTTNTYTLVIWSDNEFEKKTVDIELGKTPQEAMESLNSLYETSKKIDGSFKIEKYDCGTTSSGGTIFFFHVGDLKYTAGDYRLTDAAITKMSNALHETYQDIFGKVDRVLKCTNVSKYTITIDLINLSTNETEESMMLMLPSRDQDKILNAIKFEKDYILTDEDVKIIINWFEDGTLTDIGNKKKFIKYLNKQ